MTRTSPAPATDAKRAVTFTTTGLTTEQLIYRGTAEGRLVVPSLDAG